MHASNGFRRFVWLVALVSLAVLFLLFTPRAHGATTGVQPDWGRMPLTFVPNQGQIDHRVAYYVQGSDKVLYFTPTGVTFALTALPSPLLGGKGRRGEIPGRRWIAKLDFVGARPVWPSGQERTGAIVSYFKGAPEEWHTGLPTYSKIVYPDLWPGIDLVYSGTFQRLKYQFVVRPGADPADIRLAYRGATVRLDEAGQLEVSTPAGGFHDDAPVAYQEVAGQQVVVAVSYALDDAPRLSADESRPYGFHLGAYDPTLPLVIDPAVLVYCGYIGGSASDSGNGIAVDSSGNAYVTGYTSSTEATFPVTVGPDLYHNDYSDAFVAKVKADGTGLDYCGYIGGSASDEGSGIAVDSSGNAYVTGYTNSTQAAFPVSVGPDLDYNGGTFDAFVAKVKADGTGLEYCGYIGGDSWDQGNGIAVDSGGNAYVTGRTESTEATFPEIVGPDLAQNGSEDAFVAKVKADGTGLDYCGYIGGNGSDWGNGIAVDSGGNAYVTGITESTEATFPEIVGPDLTQNGSEDAFAAKVKADGTALDYCGYIGGGEDDWGSGIAVDSGGDAYVTGRTQSTEATFPVTVGPDLSHSYDNDVFVAKVTADGTALDYCGYIGGTGYDSGNGIAVDSAGNAYVTGATLSAEETFPLTVGPDLTQNGSWDAFVAKVKADGTALDYCGYIGGFGYDSGSGIAVDSGGDAYVTGRTESTEATFPEIVGPDLIQNGGGDVFVAKVFGGKASTTTLTSALNPSIYWQSVIFTATVTGSGSAPTGTVTFKDGGGAIAGCTARLLIAGQATCATASLTVGTHTITAEYSGNATYSPSTGTLSPDQVVNKANTTTAVASSANPSVVGQSLTFSATVAVVAPGTGTPGGTVQFRVDGGNLGAPVALSGGSASISTAELAVGTHTVAAQYSGDSNYAPSSGTLSLDQTVISGKSQVYLPLVLRESP